MAQYFRHRITEMLEKRGLKAGGWQEIALKESIHDNRKSTKPNLNFVESVIPYYWYNVWGRGYEDIGYKLANAGFKVVMSCATNLYFSILLMTKIRKSRDISGRVQSILERFMNSFRLIFTRVPELTKGHSRRFE